MAKGAAPVYSRDSDKEVDPNPRRHVPARSEVSSVRDEDESPSRNPACRKCGHETSRHVTRTSRNNNQGRPYYKCLDCDKFHSFADDVAPGSGSGASPSPYRSPPPPRAAITPPTSPPSSSSSSSTSSSTRSSPSSRPSCDCPGKPPAKLKVAGKSAQIPGSLYYSCNRCEFFSRPKDRNDRPVCMNDEDLVRSFQDLGLLDK